MTKSQVYCYFFLRHSVHITVYSDQGEIWHILLRRRDTLAYQIWPDRRIGWTQEPENFKIIRLSASLVDEQKRTDS